MVCLHEEEHWTMQKIADHLKMNRGSVSKIICRYKHPKELKNGGKPKTTIIR